VMCYAKRLVPGKPLTSAIVKGCREGRVMCSAKRLIPDEPLISAVVKGA